MASGIQNQEGVKDHMIRHLAVAVRSVQWSYAIFWSLSTKQQGVLEWGDGYYNGDIKTRKTISGVELKPDKMGLERSKQLRELYEYLLEGEDQQAKKPAALSPDDLSHAEWYYLVCMSFVFSQGQGLPGKALAKNNHIWICNAHNANTKVFSRSLLAKSAAIETVMCFPYLGGVIELGVTDQVLEDPNLIQHIKASLLEFSKPVCSDKSLTAPQKRDDDADLLYAKVDNEEADAMALDTFCSETKNMGFNENEAIEFDGNIQEEINDGSPDDCPHWCEHNHQTEDPFIFEGINGGGSQVQSWHFMDDDFSNCVQDSMNSSDCISQAFLNQEKVIHTLKIEGTNKTNLKELQQCSYKKLNSLKLGIHEDLHYQETISKILRRNSHRLLDSLHSQRNVYKSSFLMWTRREIFEGHKSRVSQQLLKKILINVPLMHSCGSMNCEESNNNEDRPVKLKNGELRVEYGLPDKRMETEKFLLLGSMVPTINKTDKTSVLDDAIEYLKELEARVEELESCIDLSRHEEQAQKMGTVLVEKAFNKYKNKKGSSKRAWLTKRKTSDIDESSDPELSSVVPKDGPLLDMKVTIKEQEVSVEMRCPWREYLLHDIIDAINNLNMDAHSVKSSTVNGILTVTLESKFRGPAVASATMIKHTLSTIAENC